ncbi:homoserine dehydrogenase [Limnochorda pilosa]|uniref:Homoserine dehydrogenase n=1 Tax=Limnochorda pilosa TaxID=1555112 RepID=A0A0K2SKS0_LIMPI|nr:homoserine dehydrogenase [Limnochorda pilosa]BAS27617.1 homoserine dehydrogenase [Limnochorda pilosa]
MTRPVGVALLGAGTVGTGVLRILERHRERIAARAGGPLEVRRILVRSLDRHRPEVPASARLTTDSQAALDDPGVDLVVEVMGGEEPAQSLIRAALERGKHVVTANKSVLARAGGELLERYPQRLYFEASVAGGIPIIKPLQECLIANRLERVLGIVNGTTNYVLTRMDRAGLTFEQALAEAQAAGYAEADPTYDVDGLDAAHKLVILAMLAFEAPFGLDDVHVEGIGRVHPTDLAYAREFGYTVKLLAVARRHDAVELRVHPALVPRDHPLASVEGVTNAVFVEGDAVGPLMFYGAGAGSLPTASSVVADMVEAARRIRATGQEPNGRIFRDDRPPIRPPSEMVSRFYLRFRVVDRPGVLAEIAGAFGRHRVSIESMIQKGRGSEPVDLVFVTHPAREADLRLALDQIRGLDSVHDLASCMRVERGQEDA